MPPEISVKATLIDNISKELKQIQRKMDKSFEQMGKSSGKLTEKVAKNRTSMINLKTVMTGLVVVTGIKLVKAFIAAGSEMEKLTTQFTTILGSAKAAKDRMQELTRFAATTPFQLQGIANASRTLETLTQGALSTGDGLRLVGDAAAATGADFQNLAINVGRAFDGLKNNRPVGEAMQRLQELGLVSGEVRGKIEELTKQGLGVEAWELLEKQLLKTKGGMTALSKTVPGLASTIKDQLNLAMIQMMDSGVWDALRVAMTDVTAQFDKALEDGTFERMGQAFANLVPLLNAAAVGVTFLADKFGGFIKLQSDFFKILTGNIDDFGNDLTTTEGKLKSFEDQARITLKIVALARKEGDAELLKSAKFRLDMQLIRQKMLRQTLIDERNLSGQDKLSKEEIVKRAKKQIEFDKMVLENRKKLNEETSQLIVDLNRENAEEEKERRATSAQGEIDLSNFIADHNAGVDAKTKADNEALAANQKKLRGQVTKDAIGNSLALVSLFKDSSKEMFVFTKALAIAQASMNTFEGVTAALSLKLPPPLPQIQAGIIGALGAAQVIKIASTSFKAALGADFVTSGRQLMMVGDNAGGRERVQVTPIGSPNINGPRAEIKVIPIFIERDDDIVEKLERASELKRFDWEKILPEEFLANIRGGVSVG